jgi:hypothetical protein
MYLTNLLEHNSPLIGKVDLINENLMYAHFEGNRNC